MIIIIFFENMVFDAFLACLFNAHYLIFLSMVMNMHILLWIYLEKGPLMRVENFYVLFIQLVCWLPICKGHAF